MKRALYLLLLIAVTTAQARTEDPANATDSLKRFFKDVQSYSARFNQVLLDDTANKVQESSGALWIERPNKFRWNYDTPFKQQIVGDGEKIWIYDPDLQQVTVRPMTKALSDTPAVLLSGRGSVEDSFVVKDLGTKEKVQWVQLLPKKKESGFEEVRIGFEAGKIRVLEMVDGFGQTARYMLRQGLENAKIDTAKFVFTPPPGVDVVGE